jgi:hypothetical protein
MYAKFNDSPSLKHSVSVLAFRGMTFWSMKYGLN